MKKNNIKDNLVGLRCLQELFSVHKFVNMKRRNSPSPFPLPSSLKSAFTLAEMMVVLLVLSLITAAFLPVITTRTKANNGSPWQWVANGSGDTYFGNSANQGAVIGAPAIPGTVSTRLLINTKDATQSAITFQQAGATTGALKLYTNDNIGLGLTALNPATTGVSNVAIGTLSLSSNTTGKNNAAVGPGSLSSNTTGIQNAGYGSGTLASNTTGSSNTAIGQASLLANVGGNNNTALGYSALLVNSAGDNNTALGWQAGSSVTVSNTTSVGYNAQATGGSSIAAGLNTQAIGASSVAIGNGSKASADNTVTIGQGAMAPNTHCIAIGNAPTASGFAAFAIGYQAKANGDYSNAIGYQTNTGVTAGGYSNAFGFQALAAGGNGVAIGNQAKAAGTGSNALGHSSTASGTSSVAIGDTALSNAQYSNAIGYQTNTGITAGGYSNAIGYQALAAGVNSIAIGNGAQADVANPGYLSAIAIGSGATAQTEKSLAIGSLAQAGVAGQTPTQGHGSTAVGNDSKSYGGWSSAYGNDSQSSGFYSSAMGQSSRSTGDYSIAIGSGANALTAYALVIGEQAGKTTSGGYCNIYGKGSNAADYGDAIGYDVQVGPGTAGLGDSIRAASATYSLALGSHTTVANTNSTALGVYSTTSADHQIMLGRAGDTVVILGTFQNLSDRRVKNVKGVNIAGLEQIRKLQPYNFTFKKDEKKSPRVGVIAQDLQKVFPDAVDKDDNGFLMIRQEDMFYAMLNSIKQLDTIVQGLVKDLKALVARVQTIEDKIIALVRVDQINSKKIDKIYQELNQVKNENRELKTEVLKLKAKTK